MDKFYYVVASKWDSGRLRIYTYGSEVQHGPIEEAEAFLEYVRGKEGGEEYKIYKVNFEEVVV